LKKVIIGLCSLALTLVITGCAENKTNHSNNNTSTPKTEQKSNPPASIVAGEIEPSLVKKSDTLYKFVLRNQNDQPMSFSTPNACSLTHTVVDQNGNHLEQDQEMFCTQAVEEFTLKPGASKTYTVDLSRDELKAGTYTLQVVLNTTDGKNFSSEMSITVK
jgi:hypothetical protein